MEQKGSVLRLHASEEERVADSVPAYAEQHFYSTNMRATKQIPAQAKALWWENECCFS